MDILNESENKPLSDSKSASLPDFETLRCLAEFEPQTLETLRIALCQKVIDDAPMHAKQRLAGLLFQLNSRQRLNRKNLMLAATDNSSATTNPLALIQNMLKDLHAMQTESIYLSTRKYQNQLKPRSTAVIYSFKNGPNLKTD